MMPKRAWAYIVFIYISGGAIVSISIFSTKNVQHNWLLFAILLACSTATQLFRVEAPSHQLYHPAFVFLMSGALLLDPLLFNLMVITSHLAEWMKEHWLKSKHLQDWYIQPFNIGMHILLGASVRFIYNALNPNPGDYTSLLAIAGAFLGALVYVFLNHLIVGLVISLARKVTFRESAIFEWESLMIDYFMLIMGYTSAVLMSLNYWLLITVLPPLYLIYRVLSVPQLKQQANVDPKTGLWNAEYFTKALEVEINRATRHERPLTVVMADIDLLRNINNTYGHIAGDAVLVGIADIFRASFREYDVVARFGGEEFSILIPETSAQAAKERIETIREKIEYCDFRSPVNTQQRIRATMSFGLAELNHEYKTVKELLHRADVAVYAAKLNGRNQCCVYSRDLMNVLNA
jgi:diguanylate cyclase (GGDEF)-like protein